MKRYAAWCRRHGSTMQCNPVMLIPIAIVALAITCYIYREVILTTLLIGVLALASVAFASGCIAITVNTVRWYRAKAKAERATMVPAAPAAELETTDADAAAIAREADWLASGVELAWSPDGKSLRAK
jgi:hypothetical protein